MFEFWSVLPPLVAIFLAVKTNQVYLALIGGIWFGWFVVSGFNLFGSISQTIESIVDVFSSAGNTKTIIFCALIGALIRFFTISGGVSGFISIAEKALVSSQGVKTQKLQFLALVTGLVLFIESSISILVVGAIFLPLFRKYNIAKEKLAYIADSGSAPSSILLPFNAWGAFLMALMVSQGIESPFTLLISTIPFNFYAIFAILILLSTIFLRKEINPMRSFVENAKLKQDFESTISGIESKSSIKANAINMILPLIVMLVVLPVVLIMSGWQGGQNNLGANLLEALGAASGSTAVLYAIVSAIFFAAILYRAQGIMRTKELVENALDGIKEFTPLAILMILAFAMGDICKTLGTGQYLANLTSGFLSPIILPSIIFVLSGATAFATGTSFGTFAVMMPIAVPMCQETGADMTLCLAALMGGGVFGDHCSPISDTTIISTMATDTNHIDHVRTQLPYALLAAGLAIVGYILTAWILQ